MLAVSAAQRRGCCGIHHDGIAVLLGVLIDDGAHLAADFLHEVVVGGFGVVGEILRIAIEDFLFGGQFFGESLARIGGQGGSALADAIVERDEGGLLFLHAGLTGSEAGLHGGGGFAAILGAQHRVAHGDDGNLGG